MEKRVFSSNRYGQFLSVRLLLLQCRLFLAGWEGSIYPHIKTSGFGPHAIAVLTVSLIFVQHFVVLSKRAVKQDKSRGKTEAERERAITP